MASMGSKFRVVSKFCTKFKRIISPKEKLGNKLGKLGFKTF